MPFRIGPAGIVGQRSLADWPVVLAAWLLLVSATTLLATGVIYGDAVAAGGLHRALNAAPPADRAMVVSLSTGPASRDGLDAVIRPEIHKAMAATGGEVIAVARLGAFASAELPADQVHDLTVLESVEGIEQRASLVSGTWPIAGQDPIQATISDAAARSMRLAVGGRLALVSRLDPTRTASIVISGIWSVEPTDSLWIGDALETTGTTAGGTFTTRGPLVIRDADLAGIGGPAGRLEMSWRGLPTIANLRVDGVDALRTGAADLSDRLRGTVPAGVSARVATGLPALLDDVGRSVLVSRSGVVLLTIQFAILAGYAVLLVAGMLVDRRRAEIALMRSRGASSLHLIGMALVEAVALAVPAAILGPFLALAVVVMLGTFGPTAGLGVADAALIGPSAIGVAVLAGLASIVALTVPTLSVTASPAGARAALGRQATVGVAQRLGLDVALAAVAAVALWQLRLYGAPLTRNARGAFGLDPLLVAAPAIGLVAGAVLALRVVPRVAEVGEHFLARDRGLVGSLGGRQLARRPLRYSRVALLLMLAAALGTLAAAHSATWSRSQVDQAGYEASADVRVIASDYSPLATWEAGPAYRAIPGVTAATPLTVSPFDVGRTVREGVLAGLDPLAASIGVSAGSGSPSADPAAIRAALATARLDVAGVALPGQPARIAVTLDAAFKADPEVGLGVIRADAGGLTASAVLRDADGRLFRTTGIGGAVDRAGQRLILSLVDPDRAELRPRAPLALAAIEIMIEAVDPIAIYGNVSLRRVEVSDSGGGNAGWVPVGVSATTPGWSWVASNGQGTIAAAPAVDGPDTVGVSRNQAIGRDQSQFGTTFRLSPPAPRDPVIAAVASRSFLDQTGGSVGDEFTISSLGSPLRVRVLAATDIFAPFDPAVPFLLVDLRSLDTVRFAADGRPRQADQWLISVAPGSEPAVVAALRARDAGTSAVVGRAELSRSLLTDPVPLGLIGVLGLGSIAAMLFAAIGFLVSSTISASERIGEFALLRALGLSSGQLALWLSIESTFLLLVGLVAGSLLGVLLAWLVLPFATLTQTGLAPVPTPVLIVPWEAVAPPFVAAAILFLLSLWLARRQLPDVRISAVLRARES